MFRKQPTYKIIESTIHAEIQKELTLLGVSKAHFTNGTYALSPEITVATTLAGFKYVLENSDANLPLIIAVNSDQSMREMDKLDCKDQKSRADSVAKPLAAAFPENRVIVIFYNEATPYALYKLLSERHMTHTLHKWGYGTEAGAPKVEGAELFDHVYAYPLIGQQKPVCWDDTPVTDQKTVIKIADLRGALISTDRKCLFALPESLQIYQDASVAKAEQNILPTI